MNVADVARQAITLVTTYAEIIQLARQIPNGHLYALAMTKGISLNVHLQMISVLKDARLVAESNNLLVWVGPQGWTPPPVEAFLERVLTREAQEHSRSE